ncbi:DNA-binding LacI/PurR family transcriptional regulator [Microbacterium sp. SLBN-154]|uniref:LacI family DNA-binding transcriptional regulator n=1 Tax=Microbacterium sp. SLBN-154 TaxID=2768458 RepID=UPI001151D8BA|nr:LacI family DNA-binding transcriptional regulator [Microbacterium sp. SLBN-154]TQK20733.1 DNA-binding LacI/PurR family transcriptional regulator [Microbacterium sp. SLBN-154]
MAGRPTSRDVARLAGVTQATVSYALSGKGSISPETRDRVKAAARELGYQPNLAARAMRTRRTGRIAVVMGIPIYNPVQMLAGAGAAAADAGFVMEVHSVDGTIDERSQRIVELAGSGQYEGVLSFVPASDSAPGAIPPDVGFVVAASFDEAMHSAGELADASPVASLITRLADWGHTRFLHVAGERGFASADSRAQVFQETVAHLGLENLGVVGHAWTGEAGLEAIRSLPASARPLAVVAANDLVAVGAMRGAAERGWKITHDISVTGWDNYDVGRFLWPALTTVDNNRAEAGRHAMRRLIALLRKADNEVLPAEPPRGQIIWRESTGPPRW